MPSYLPTLNWPIYSGWTNFTPTIPKMYWDVYSQEQRFKDLCKSFGKVEQYLDYVVRILNEWGIEFNEEIEAKLRAIWDEINNGYKDALSNWFIEDLPDILNAAMKMVFFGLTPDGYFCAWIPSSWDGIVFDTVVDYLDDNYGCLILKY